MKRLMTAGIMSLMLAGSFSPLPLRADEKMMGKTPAEKQKKMADHLEKMSKDLNLNTDQQTAVRTAMQAKMDKMDGVMAEYDQAVRAVLTPEQTKKYDTMMKDKK